MITLRPEHALVVCCARTQTDEQTVAQIKTLLNGTIDWNYLYNFARRHSVIPLVYLQLNKIAPESVPSKHLRRLKDYYQQNTGRNLYLTNELGRLLEIFSAAGIEAIPYKGPALAVSAYGKLNLRRFVDLDVMVRKADVLRAKELLIETGYRSNTEWSKSQESLLLRTQHNLSLSRENGRLIVELHWEVAPELYAPSLQAEQLWERLAPMELHRFKVKSLSPEDLFLSICVHGCKHLWTRLAILPALRQSFAFNLRLREGWPSRIRYCRLLLRPTDGDLSAVSLPRLLNFAYYSMRPFRLLRANWGEKPGRLGQGPSNHQFSDVH